jgi:glutamine amidotransferase
MFPNQIEYLKFYRDVNQKTRMIENDKIKICILNYGSGNVRSVKNIFTFLGAEPIVSCRADDIRAASHLVLPGVGSFGVSMEKIHSKLPLNILEKEVLDKKKPFLGICVGMQILAERGYEYGEFDGLGWIPGTVRKLDSNGLRLPHIGWNNINTDQKSVLFEDFEKGPDFYFIHSYVFEPEDKAIIIATSDYGEIFCSAIQKENIFGVQFHPEKSQKAGMLLLLNFLDTT